MFLLVVCFICNICLLAGKSSSSLSLCGERGVAVTTNVVKLCERICRCTIMYICEYISARIMIGHQIFSSKKLVLVGSA